MNPKERARHRPNQPPANKTNRERRWLIYVTVFVSGAAVLVLEILGTRLLSPYFGSNLYVWSALISVTLLALALGYWMGGQVADARGSSDLLDRILLVAALLTGAIPPLVRLTVSALESTPFEAALLISALVCFGPALFALGTISPVAVRLVAEDFGHVGRSVGGVYTWSTIGSIAGALAAGFLLLPNVPVSRICYATAVVLLALATARWLRREVSSPAGAAAAVILFTLWWIGFPAGGEFREEDGFRLVASRPSFYGGVQVVESAEQRYLLLDGAIQTIQTQGRRNPAGSYVWVMSLLPQFRPAARRLVLIGLGGGDLVHVFGAYGIRTTAIEIDPVVAQTAINHFNLGSNEFDLVIGDGRFAVRQLLGTTDLIVLDAYAGGSPPVHLFSREAFAEMKGTLTSSGVLAVNLIVRGHDDLVRRDVSTTLSAVFRNVLAIATEQNRTKLGNVVLFASDETLALPDEWPAPPLGEGHKEFLDGMRNLILPVEGLTGSVITDELNPMDVRGAATDVSLRQAARQFFPLSFLER